MNTPHRRCSISRCARSVSKVACCPVRSATPVSIEPLLLQKPACRNGREMHCHCCFRRGETNAIICPHGWPCRRYMVQVAMQQSDYIAYNIWADKERRRPLDFRCGLLFRVAPPPHSLGCARHVTLVVCLLLYIVPPPARQACAHCLCTFFSLVCVASFVRWNRGCFLDEYGLVLLMN